ncbi:adenosylcobinamide-phosphate synthase CbiB [Natrialbaceae archaeon AArc-T1-2]|uniref:adenosylcobinamide-phosphate synthase CbiB n=1 Tax=Natrialbaceae archaeon AArc-T1-2 TaxID=3053904 RepID=UPI00255AB856|nr:adenosylcobinamide-phosphate synthase CbiB [Natrialbaceae archaeon AArc-T1-2]WIV65835.1 adenosylcobinamide-phosphate synthase CbiB [Natrialbaceae archaeon AArc-T1-2]
MSVTILAIVAFAFVLDLAVGEPPTAVHPVAWFGRLVGTIDREWVDGERGQRLAGVAIAVLAPVLAATIAGVVVVAAGTVHSIAGVLVATLVLYATTSLRMLLELARTVIEESEADLETARERIRGLVGRDASELSPAQLRSAAVESAGENLADGLVAPLLAFAILAPVSLPAAAAAAAWVKAVNTLDSMLGYPSKPVGTASARLDDLVMWLPARVAAVAVALAATDPRSLVRARRDARVPDSPNSGWPMATLSVALEVRLEKPGAYVLNEDGELPTLADGQRAVRLVGVAGGLAVGLCGALAVGVATVVAAESAVVLATAGVSP